MSNKINEVDAINERLNDIKKRFDKGFSSQDKVFIENVHQRLFGTGVKNKGCNSCYRDAFVLIVSKLKNLKNMPERSKYRLKSGAVYTEPFTGKTFIGDVKEEDAKRLLSLYPNLIDLFATYPEDWDKPEKKSRKKSGETDTPPTDGNEPATGATDTNPNEGNEPVEGETDTTSTEGNE